MSGTGLAQAKLLAARRMHWQFGSNDPTLGGWAVTAGYAAAAWLALLAAREGAARSFDRRFWSLACAVLLLLAVNTQLDLQTLLTDLGRAWAADHGWYERRRTLQSGFVAGILATGALGLVWGWRMTRWRAPMIRLALAGLAATFGYLTLRAASFHHADAFLRTEIAGMRWDWLVEVAGFALTGFAAWRYRR